MRVAFGLDSCSVLVLVVSFLHDVEPDAIDWYVATRFGALRFDHRRKSGLTSNTEISCKMSMTSRAFSFLDSLVDMALQEMGVGCVSAVRAIVNVYLQFCKLAAIVRYLSHQVCRGRWGGGLVAENAL